MNHIPEHIVEEVRSHSDIVDVIGEHVALQRRGKNFLGLCPFHNEKTPSFNVNPELGIYKCFGCGKSGNVISFLMEHNGQNFVESVRFLANKAGITIPTDDITPKEQEQQNKTDLAYKALQSALEYYSKQLQTKEGSSVRTYFLNRDFSADAMQTFGLGYAPDNWSATMMHLIKQGYTQETLVDAGLVIDKEDGKVYDRFRGRAMFAVHDSMGRVVGFGARILTDVKDQPKYINSPQSLVYDKSKILYGLFQAKQHIRQEKSSIMVEGYADVITLHENGFRNAVASSGTSLTNEQLDVLSRYSTTMYLVYDGDAAGINAAMRGVELALNKGFEVNIVTLPNKEDPDSFVRRNGAETFRTFLRNAPNFIDYLSEQYKQQGMLATPKGQAEAVRTLVKLISLVQDALQRDIFLRSVAQRFSLQEQLLYDELNKIIPSKSLVPVPQQYQQKKTWIKNGNKRELLPPAEKLTIQQSAITPEEKILLKIALVSPHGFMMMEEGFAVSTDTFVTTEAKTIYQAVQHAHHHGVEVAGHVMMNEALDQACKNIIGELLFADEQLSSNWSNFDVELPQLDIKKAISDSLLSLSLIKVIKQITEIQNKLKENDDHDTILAYMELVKRKNAIDMQLRGITIDEF
ncbi:MAG: DNA primase [Candidatus Kapabacteria bacterium]|nr:DNA primase [Candidatus Kapabacteria bacterium]